MNEPPGEWDQLAAAATTMIAELSATSTKDKPISSEPSPEQLQAGARGYRRLNTLLGLPEAANLPDIAFESPSSWSMNVIELYKPSLVAWAKQFRLENSRLSGWDESLATPLMVNLGRSFGALLERMGATALSSFELQIPVAESVGINVVETNIRLFARQHGIVEEDFLLWNIIRNSAFRVFQDGNLGNEYKSLADATVKNRASDACRYLAEQSRTMIDEHSAIEEGLSSDGLLLMPSSDIESSVYLTGPQSQFKCIGALFEAVVDYASRYCFDGAVNSAPQIATVLASRAESRPLSETAIADLLGVRISDRLLAKARTFLHYVVDQRGRRILPRILSSPDTVPETRDLEDPDRWLSLIEGP